MNSSNLYHLTYLLTCSTDTCPSNNSRLRCITFSDFQIHHTIIWMKWEGLPIFFGMVTAAFEGIGLVCDIV